VSVAEEPVGVHSAGEIGETLIGRDVPGPGPVCFVADGSVEVDLGVAGRPWLDGSEERVEDDRGGLGGLGVSKPTADRQ
jgi:hypothetical protein